MDALERKAKGASLAGAARSCCPYSQGSGSDVGKSVRAAKAEATFPSPHTSTRPTHSGAILWVPGSSAWEAAGKHPPGRRGINEQLHSCS